MASITPRLPNFFILGAPKCGTTSMAQWLGEHAEIFMSPFKEPHFFNTDLCYINTPSREAYHRLFQASGDHHKAIGDASVFYLYSTDAVPNIEREIPNARYIVMLRNPVEMAPSLHEQLVFAGNEHLEDFEEAWRAQSLRRQGKKVNNFCREPRLLLYEDVCRLGEQVERLLRLVPRNRVHFTVMDDLKVDARKEYLEVLRFLDLPDEGKANFSTENVAKVRRWPVLRKIVRLANDSRRRIGVPRVGTGIMRTIDAMNKIDRKRPPLAPFFRAELAIHFENDIRLLESLLNRSLIHWRSEGLSSHTPTNPGHL